jgi:hypothetical protein
MKEFVSIKVVDDAGEPAGVSRVIYAEVTKILGISDENGIGECVFESPDPRFDILIEFLKREVVPMINLHQFDMGEGGVLVEKWLEQDASDVEEASLLVCYPKKIKLEALPKKRGEEGPFESSKSKVRSSVEFGLANGYLTRLFCSQSGKIKLENSDLRGVNFLEVKLSKPCQGEYRVWEVVPSKSLSFLSSGGYTDGAGSALREYPENGGCMAVSTLPGSIVYEADHFDSLVDDIVATSEELGATDFGRKRMHLVSQKFRKFCLDQGWDCRWIPVIES